MTTNAPILLVEDSEDDVFLMKRALSSAGVTNKLCIVEDGQQAIDYLSGAGQYANRQEYPLPVVIFLDLKLPIMSGLDVLNWIREQPELGHMVVVVLTSSNEPSDLRNSYKLGANSYVVKPPTSTQLVELARAFKWYWLEFNQFTEALPSLTQSKG